MQSLFPNRPNAANDRNVLLSFNAGKCNLSPVGINGKVTVSSDKRKGTLSLIQSPNDGLLHLQWKERNNDQNEDDVIIFPGDAAFKKVNSPVPADRIYLLKLLSGGPRRMYWLQDKSTDKDTELVEKLNRFVTDPAAVEAELASRGGGAQDPFMQMMGLQGLGGAGGGGFPGLQLPGGNGGGANSLFGGLNRGAAGRPAQAAPAAAARGPAVDELRLGTLDLSDLMAQFVNPVSQDASAAAASAAALGAGSLNGGGAANGGAASQTVHSGTATSSQMSVQTSHPPPHVQTTPPTPRALNVNPTVEAAADAPADEHAYMVGVSRSLFPPTPEADTMEVEDTAARLTLTQALDAHGDLNLDIFRYPDVLVAVHAVLPPQLHSLESVQQLVTSPGYVRDFLTALGAYIHHGHRSAEEVQVFVNQLNVGDTAPADGYPLDAATSRAFVEAIALLLA